MAFIDGLLGHRLTNRDLLQLSFYDIDEKNKCGGGVNWIKAGWAARWLGRPQGLVGLDLTAQSIRLLVLEQGSSQATRCVHAVELPLPRGAVNGLVLEGFDLIADTLAAKVQELGLEGRAVAMALPAQGVREMSWSAWDGPPQLWHEAVVYKHVQQTMQLPPEPWSLDFGLDHASPVQQAWAVVARESVVQERFELAEQVGLVPTVLDVDRFALDRLLNHTCQQVNTWPSVWMMGRDGVLSVHLALGPDEVSSASAYAMAGESALSQFKVLMAKVLQGYDATQWQQEPVAIRFTGVDDLHEGLMEMLQTYWPQAYEVQSPCTSFLESVDSPSAFAVALGLALHPGWR